MYFLPVLHGDGVAAVAALYALQGRPQAQVNAVPFEPTPDAPAGLFAEALALRDLLQANERDRSPPGARARRPPRTR
jgi:hypothetical protein